MIVKIQAIGIIDPATGWFEIVHIPDEDFTYWRMSQLMEKFSYHTILRQYVACATIVINSKNIYGKLLKSLELNIYLQ